MENHQLGTQKDKIYAKRSTGNAPNTLQFIRPICPNRPIIWDIFEKTPYHMSIVHGQRYFLCTQWTISPHDEQKRPYSFYVHQSGV